MDSKKSWQIHTHRMDANGVGVGDHGGKAGAMSNLTDDTDESNLILSHTSGEGVFCCCCSCLFVLT